MTCSCEWHRERDELIADLDRLREALEDIAANGNHPDFLAAEYAGDVLSHPEPPETRFEQRKARRLQDPDVRDGYMEAETPERCGDVITFRNDEHSTAACTKPSGHEEAHGDERGASWTDASHFARFPSDTSPPPETSDPEGNAR